MMYQLLIVDDEKTVVDSLALTIPWSDYGIEAVYQAYSAADALKIAEEQAIDVLITDIRMPEMDGLELIEHINRLSRKVKCIILSGHDDFLYAQKAMQQSAFNYLLKPVVIEELVASVQSAIETLQAEWKEISSYQRIQYTLQSNLPLLKDQLLGDLLKKKPMPASVLQERLSLLRLSFQKGDPFMLMLVRLEEDFSGYDLKSLSLLEYAVTNIAEEVFQDVFELWHGTSEQGYLVFLFKPRERTEAMKLVDSFAVKLQNHVQTYLKGNISICLSPVSVFPDSIAELYQQAVSTINRNVGANKSYFITLGDDESNNLLESSPINLFEPPLLPQLLESGSWDEALMKLEHTLQLSSPEADYTYDQLFSVFLYLSSSLSIGILKNGGNLEEQIGEDFELFLRKTSFLSKQRLYDWAAKVIANLKRSSSTYLESTQNIITAKVRSFIQEHLSEGVSLQMVADYIGLHPVYLSKVYKTVTGETIGDYLFALRMDKAAYLLKSTDLKISDISSKLGFLATPHFIKIFKKHFGSTPQEYRNDG
ncbi:response regulator transcription factor [Paenibacillus andongensis]|uniref:response regulator transcription factor n=1 Tax=Paenibacillus andongensis TaxID=2975482 RepID=UPI0021BA8560|nr:response regulator [Paenibacillus andongensis]